MKHIHIIKRSAAIKAGLKYYSNGKLCPLGHFDDRKTINGSCVQCNSLRYEMIRDEECRKKRKAYAENKEEIKEKNREWKSNNKEKVNQGIRNYRNKNPEKVKMWAKKSYENAKDYQDAYRAKWAKENPEKIRERNRRRRAAMLGAAIKLEPKQICDLLEKQKKRCAICSKKIEKNNDGKLIYHVDHIQPLSRGGSHTICNVQITCPSCNLHKSNKDPFDHAKENGKLL